MNYKEKNQYKVNDFIVKCPQPMTIDTCMLDILSEAGEVAKEINIATLWGRYPENPKFRNEIVEELGQLLFTVYQLAWMLGVDADVCLSRTIYDFEKRYAKNGHTGSSNYGYFTKEQE